MEQKARAYFEEGVVPNDPLLENEIPNGRNDDAAEQAIHAKLPGLFALSCARIDARHQEDDVQRGKGVEDLEGLAAVGARPVGRHALSEKFQVCQTSLVADEVKMSR